jgi:hypothetical protein
VRTQSGSEFAQPRERELNSHGQQITPMKRVIMLGAHDHDNRTLTLVVTGANSMGKSKKKKRFPEQRPAIIVGRRWPLIAVTILAAVGIVGAIALLQGERPGFEKLSGRWLRPDGGYILEIRDVDPRGKIDALYFNPRPINVAKAEATRDGSKINVLVELRAPRLTACARPTKIRSMRTC